MKIKALMIVMALTAALTGCSVFSSGPEIAMGPNIENIPVVMPAGSKGSLIDAVIIAANRRRWIPSKISNTQVRCTIAQRSNLIIVDVIIAPDGKSFSIRGAESNLTLAKYNQWVNNLQREIVKQASVTR